MLQNNQSFPNITTRVGPFDPNVEPSERISLSLDQSILWVQTGDWEVTADESSDSLRFCRPWCFFFLSIILLLKPDLKFRIRNCQILRNALRERANFAAASCAKNYGDRTFASDQSDVKLIHKVRRLALFELHCKWFKIEKGFNYEDEISQLKP